MALAYNLPGALHTDSFTAGDYTYTGNSVYVDDGNGKWRIKFLSSGTFTPIKNVKVDIFAVGGGGGSGGDSVFQSSLGSAGGGGGYTTTVKTQTLTVGTAYPIVVSSGGAGEPRQQKAALAVPALLARYVLPMEALAAGRNFFIYLLQSVWRRWWLRRRRVVEMERNYRKHTRGETRR